MGTGEERSKGLENRKKTEREEGEKREEGEEEMGEGPGGERGGGGEEGGGRRGRQVATRPRELQGRRVDCLMQLEGNQEMAPLI